MYSASQSRSSVSTGPAWEAGLSLGFGPNDWTVGRLQDCCLGDLRELLSVPSARH